ncbi:MAG TPA: metal ABC transporter substrate-binding protein [Nitrososphaeraceae archaeon]|nr:metal ABC transporter substrate-binding protein [Nitrososphaeraceae archaeon]
MNKGFDGDNQSNILTTILFLAVATFLSLTPLLILFATASASTNSTTESITKDNIAKLNVVSSVAPITNIIQNIGGDRINLIGLVPEGVNSHTFELVPSDAIKIHDANLVIIDGLNLEADVERTANSAIEKDPQIQLLKLGDNTVSQDDWIFDFSFPKEKGDPNPHLWLNVNYAMKFANLTRDKLIEMDPLNANYYTENSKRYNDLLRQLDDGIKKSMQTIPEENRKLLTYHDSWAYFAPRYGMTVIGAIQPSDFGEPSAKDVANLINQVREVKVPAIFASEVFPTNIIDQIAKEGNITIVETLSDDDLPGNPGDKDHSYIGMMIENMRNMIIPLGGNIEALKNVNPENISS